MKELDRLLWEIESRGNAITTHELMEIHISQYQRALKQLREKLALKGITLTEAIPIEGQKKNFLYKIIKPNHQFQLI